MQIIRSSTAILISTPHYAMEIIATEPIVVIKLNHKTDQQVVQMIKEMSATNHSASIQISSDAMLKKDQGRLSIGVGVVAKKTPALAKQITRSGALWEINHSNTAENIATIYTASCCQTPDVANRFFETCMLHLANGSKIPIKIFDGMGDLVTSFQTRDVTRFSWNKLLAELR